MIKIVLGNRRDAPGRKELQESKRDKKDTLRMFSPKLASLTELCN